MSMRRMIFKNGMHGQDNSLFFGGREGRRVLYILLFYSLARRVG